MNVQLVIITAGYRQKLKRQPAFFYQYFIRLIPCQVKVRRINTESFFSAGIIKIVLGLCLKFFCGRFNLSRIKTDYQSLFRQIVK